MKKENISLFFGLFGWILIISLLSTVYIYSEKIVSNQMDSIMKMVFAISIPLLFISFILSCIGVILTLKNYRNEVISRRKKITSMCLNGSFLVIWLGGFIFSIVSVWKAMMGI